MFFKGLDLWRRCLHIGLMTKFTAVRWANAKASERDKAIGELVPMASISHFLSVPAPAREPEQLERDPIIHNVHMSTVFLSIRPFLRTK